MTETTTEITKCENPMVDATRSIASALGQTITCDKSKGYLMLIGMAIVLIILIKVFLIKK